MELEKLLAKKRRRAAYKLVLPIIGEFLIMSVPKPALEVPTEAVLSVAEMAILFDIWQLYFDDDLEENDLKVLLEEMGLMVLFGSIATFLTAKLSNALAGEAGNFVPGIGWIIEGLVASIITLIAGILWINFCEKVYRGRFDDSGASSGPALSSI